MKSIKFILYSAALVMAPWALIPVYAVTSIYSVNQHVDLMEFDESVDDTPTSIDFEDIMENTHMGGLGIEIEGTPDELPIGLPLMVVDGNISVDPDGFSDDELRLVFQQPMSSFGFYHLSRSAAGFNVKAVQVLNQNYSLLSSNAISRILSEAIPNPRFDVNRLRRGNSWDPTSSGAHSTGLLDTGEDDAGGTSSETEATSSDTPGSFNTPPLFITSVPEPTTFFLLVIGLLLMVGYHKGKLVWPGKQ